MNLNSALKNSGVTISEKTDTNSFIKVMQSVPYILQLFPDVKNMVDTIASYYNTLLSAESTLKSLQDDLSKAQDVLTKAKDSYDKQLNTPMAYMGKGTGEVAINPQPSLSFTYNVIVQAQNALDVAEDNVQKAIERVEDLKKKIDEAKQTFIKKLMSIKVS